MKITYDVFGATDIGKRRKENQDNFSIDRDIGLYMVADGLGGLDYGKEAAEYAVTRLSLGIRTGLEELAEKNCENICKLLEKEIYTADKGMRKHYGYNTATTITIVLIHNNKVYVTHVGDSRVYMFKRHVLHQITEDHNMANQYVKFGTLTKEAASRHPSQCMLTNSIGMMNETQDKIVINPFPIKKSMRLLLCSDGLTGLVTDKEISDIMDKNASSEETCKVLIKEALDNGGDDNVTVVIIDVKVEE